MALENMNRRLTKLENTNSGTRLFLISDDYPEEEKEKECERLRSSVSAGVKSIFLMDEFGESSLQNCNQPRIQAE